MEQTYECVRNENGEIEDPVFSTIIPEHRVILVTEGNARWCMDAAMLLKNMLLYDNVTNPLTRQSFSNEVLSQLDKYRHKQLRVVILVNTNVHYTDTNRSVPLMFNSFDLVGDIIALASLGYDDGKSIAKLSLLVDGESLYALDLESELESFGPVTVVYTSLSNLNKSDYERIKAFVSKYDRYKYDFSPFPEYEGRVMQESPPRNRRLSPTIESVQSGMTRSLPVSSRRSQSPTRESPTRESPIREPPISRRSQSPTRPPIELTRSEVRWVPNYASLRPSDEGTWPSWMLMRTNAPNRRPPPNYNGEGMPQELVEAINNYNIAPYRGFLPLRGIGGIYAPELVDNLLPLPDPVIRNVPPRAPSRWYPVEYQFEDMGAPRYLWDVSDEPSVILAEGYRGEGMDRALESAIRRYDPVRTRVTDERSHAMDNLRTELVRNYMNRLGPNAREIIYSGGSLPPTGSRYRL